MERHRVGNQRADALMGYGEVSDQIYIQTKPKAGPCLYPAPLSHPPGGNIVPSFLENPSPETCAFFLLLNAENSTSPKTP